MKITIEVTKADYLRLEAGLTVNALRLQKQNEVLFASEIREIDRLTDQICGAHDQAMETEETP